VSDSSNQATPEHNSLIAGQGTLGPLVRLATPVVMEQLLVMMVMMVDVYLVGRYIVGEAELAAVGLIAYTLWLLSNVFELVCSGTTAVVARCIGAGNRAEARRIANQSLIPGVVLAAVVVVIGLTMTPFLVGLMRLREDAAALAISYLDYIWPVIPLIMLERVGIACLRASGNMIIVFLVMAVVNLVNVLLSTALVVGWFGLPELGWDGVAIGTAAAHVTGGVLTLLLMSRGYAGLGWSWKFLRPDAERIRRILRIGIPGGADVLSVIGCHMAFLAIINDLGDLAAAAHNVALRLESMAYLPAAGLTVAATTLTGQFLGAGDRQRAARCLVVACMIGSVVLMAVGVVFWFAGYYLAIVFVDATNSEVVTLAAELLKIAAYGMLPLALQMILSGGLRGAGDTRWPMVFTIVSMLGLRLPLAYVLSSPRHYDMGVVGAWWAMLLDMTVRCWLIVWRFRHGGWQRTKV